MKPVLENGIHIEDDVIQDLEELEDYNYIFWYGCKPNNSVDAISTISEDFFVELRKHAIPIDGTVNLPEALANWRV